MSVFNSDLTGVAKGHAGHGVYKKAPSGSSQVGGESYQAANPDVPQAPPGSDAYKQAGSPRRSDTGAPIPTNTKLTASQGGPADTPLPGVPSTVNATRPDYQAKDLGGGAMRMEDKNTGESGSTYNFTTPSGPADMSNPAWKAEADKASSMYSEPGQIQSAALEQAKSGKQNFANPLSEGGQ